MNKISEPKRYRSFLIDDLPVPLTRASSHLQITDRYVANTTLRLRSIRDPSTGAVNKFIQKYSTIRGSGISMHRSDDIHLTDNEFALFEPFPATQLRKNRYFHEFDRQLFTFDVYLGDHRGLATASTDFNDAAEMENFETPPFAILEITSDPFFDGQNLAGRPFSSISAEIERLRNESPEVLLQDE